MSSCGRALLNEMGRSFSITFGMVEVFRVEKHSKHRTLSNLESCWHKALQQTHMHI